MGHPGGKSKALEKVDISLARPQADNRHTCDIIAFWGWPHDAEGKRKVL